MLQDLGRWGSGLLDAAAPAAASATGFARNSLASGADLVRSGAKSVSKSVKGNIAPVFSAKHTFDDPHDGSIHNVCEVSAIAEGGFGLVLKVRDNDGREFALKKIGCQEGVQVASTFASADLEATVLKKLPPHDNIIRCYGSSVEDHGPDSKTVKLLLELCPGGTLMDYMDNKNGNLSAKEVVQPFSQIVTAVTHLHARRPPIQHRDLKVENVLKGSDGHWKLCDFGSCSTEVVPPQEFSRSRYLELQEEFDKTVTMLYRPPEMADIELNYRNGYEINSQVDIWMLGCILYTLTFYRHPFQDNPTAMAISNGRYFIPDDHPLGKSAKLCGIIHWLLAKDPKDRPTAPRITELLQEIGKCQYEELFEMMPSAVQEKIKKINALFAKRKDTGDIPLPPAAAALLANSSSASAGSSAKPAKQQQREPARGTRQSKSADFADFSADFSSGYSAQASSAPAADAFDLMSALAPSGRAASQGNAGAAQRQAAVAAPSPVEDLLCFTSPQPAPAAPSPAPAAGGDFGDLLSFTNPAPSSSNGAAPAAPANEDWCDFANFTSAPGPPAAVSTPVSTPAPGASNSSDLLGFASFDSFADPLAPSPAPPSGPVSAPAAQSCSGAARAGAPPAASSFNLLDM